MVSLARQLALAASKISFQIAPAVVQDRLCFAVKDVVAALISGSSRSEIRTLRSSFASGSGPSTAIGLGKGVSPSLAAFINGLPVASEQLQDGHRLARGHPMSHILPAVLAVGEAQGSSGDEFFSAALAGYELGVHLGIAMRGTVPDVHDIGTWAGIGSTAAVAYLLSNGSPEVISASVEIAASEVLAFDAKTVFEGASAQHLFLASSCQNAVTNGYAAASGLRALDGTLERYYLPRVACDMDLSLVEQQVELAGEWISYSIIDSYHKVHPTCAHLHGINDAIDNIIADGVLDPNQIASVKVETYRGASVFSNPSPANDLSARFSIPYTVAVALLRGTLDNSAFDDVWLNDTIVRDLANRIEVVHDLELDCSYPSGRPARVTVTSKDGQCKSSFVIVPVGDGKSALMDARVLSKPANLLRRTIGEAQSKEITDAIDNLANGQISDLSSVLRTVMV